MSFTIAGAIKVLDATQFVTTSWSFKIAPGNATINDHEVTDIYVDRVDQMSFGRPVCLAGVSVRAGTDVPFRSAAFEDLFDVTLGDDDDDRDSGYPFLYEMPEWLADFVAGHTGIKAEPAESKQSVSNRARRALCEADLDVADVCGSSAKGEYLQAAIDGKCPFNPAMLFLIAERAEVSAEYLLNGADQKPGWSVMAW